MASGQPVTLIPWWAFAIPPGRGGVTVRFWDKDFNLLAQNAADVPAARFLTVDSFSSDSGRMNLSTSGLHPEPI